MKPMIIAVIVTYFPNRAVLEAQLLALLPQVSCAVIIDNGSSEAQLSWLSELCQQQETLTLIPLEQNFGIAKAQNDGIAWAKQVGAHFVLLMDQDSLPAPDMVDQLLLAHQTLSKTGVRVAAIGPKFIDVDSGRVSKHVRFGWFSVSRVDCDDASYLEVDFLISSGSLISMTALDVIGDMDASLFIDHVDTEWVLRAKSKGWLSFGHCKARMFHSLGEHRIRLLQIIIFMAIVPNERRNKIKMIWRGIKDGFRGVTGKMSD